MPSRESGVCHDFFILERCPPRDNCGSSELASGCANTWFFGGVLLVSNPLHSVGEQLNGEPLVVNQILFSLHSQPTTLLQIFLPILLIERLHHLPDRFFILLARNECCVFCPDDDAIAQAQRND